MRTALLLLLLAPALYAQSSLPGVRVMRDVPYVPNAGPRQRLDVYIPEGAAQPLPLIVWIHGGGWQAGNKADCPAREFIPSGYAAASVEYRFSQDAVWPAQIQDCEAAIAWLRGHAKELNIDPKRIGVWGASAGGHLVAMLGVTGAEPDHDPAVQCVVDYFGPTDFLHFGDEPRATPGPAAAVVAKLLGGPVSTHQDLARNASPVYFVNAYSAPFLIVHGGNDPVVPLQQSQELAAKLKAAGIEATLQVIPGAGHGGAPFFTPEVRKQVLDFLNRHLKPATGG